MYELLSSIWKALYSKVPSGEKLSARIISSGADTLMYCALDANQKRHLLIAFDGKEEFIDRGSKGIAVSTRELVLGQQDDSQMYIDIKCHHSSGHGIFDLLIAEIADSLKDESLSVSVAVSNVLERWRRFWQNLPVRTLTREEQIGLFAEIRFLREWLISVSNPLDAVNSWRGPYGGKDFRSENFSVEVKSTTSEEGHVYSINSLEQLTELPERGMYLFGLLLIEVVSGKENLVDEVKKTREILSELPEGLDKFEEGLLRIGYSDFHSNEYRELKFNIREECLFEVREDFPQLSREKVEIPIGVEGVQYTINLNSFNHLVLAKKPSEWSS